MSKIMYKSHIRTLTRRTCTFATDAGARIFRKSDKFPRNTKNSPSSPKYQGQLMVTLIEGSTLISKHAASTILRLFESARVPLTLERIIIGSEEKALDNLALSVQRNRLALQVCIPHAPKRKHETHLLNSYLGLFACVIKLRSYPGYNCRYPKANMTLIAQNISGDLTKLEYQPVKGIVETLRIFQENAIRRYFRFVFDYAKKYNHSQIVIGHKQNKLPITDGKFLEIAREVESEKNTNVAVELMDVDDLVHNLIIKPEMFDLICTSARYGTFVAATASAVCGGAGLFSAVEQSRYHAVFKPLDAKLSLTDLHALSPYSIVRSCIDLLQHLGNWECAKAMEDQLLSTMMKSNIKTADYGGIDSPEYVIAHIVNGLKCKLAS